MQVVCFADGAVSDSWLELVALPFVQFMISESMGELHEELGAKVRRSRLQYSDLVPVGHVKQDHGFGEDVGG